ncbi:MAG: winged helix-turn-helix transcriptional regulator [Austwickia sp.]|nr:winged helix-turn-helix transcriptional regulator [Austwickia sp.]MBK8435395.1 winged helix-turn-helix transcriptional regulator [Austwickia sp.]MBK9101058.1 winged helix-turn-helix transcriptional regulator [Austwickia sp.]
MAGSTADPVASAPPGTGEPASGGDSRDQVHEAGTRDRVLTMISQEGPITVAAIAKALGLTTTGVRRHLDVLVEQAVVAPCEHMPTSRGRGRPARGYVLTAAGHQRMNSQYDDVATAALRYLAHTAGPQAVTEFAQHRVADAERRYAAAVAGAGPTLGDRVHALATALAQDGYAASTRPVAAPDPGGSPEGRGVQLCQGHCPMHQVAAEFPQFCELETEAFARLLGVHVQRLSTLAGGGHVCTTFIPQPAAVAPSAPAHPHIPSEDPQDPEKGTTP